MTTLHRPESLRAFLDGGGDLAEVDVDVVERLVEVAIETRTLVDDPLDRAERALNKLAWVEEVLADPAGLIACVPDPQVELTLLSWGAEVLLDDALAERIVPLLPAGLVAEARANLDCQDRPYVLSRDERLFKCGCCGTVCDGPCVAVVSRGSAWPVFDDCPPLTFCPDCVNWAGIGDGR